MKTAILAIFFSIAVAAAAFGSAHRGPDGAALFKRHCAGCHRQVTRFRLDKNILQVMRRPPSPMPVFLPDKISESEAKAIVEYIQLQVKMKTVC